MPTFHRFGFHFLTAALGFGLLSGCQTEPEVETEEAPTADVAPAPPAEPMAIVDYTALADATTPADNIGRQVQLSNLQVGRVTGDRTFLVQPQGGGKTMLVYLEDAGAAAGGPGVSEGDVIGVEGVIDRMPAQEALMSDWGVDQDEFGQIGSAQIYIRANSVTRPG
jgi:hypothetical protein